MADVPKSSSDTIVPVLSYTYQQARPAAISLFEGIIDSWDLAEGRIDLSVTNILSQWSQQSLSPHSPSCRWKVFGGDECTYSGNASWCDRSYRRCGTLGNTDNFGGFRWLPSLVGKEIWWGRMPDTGGPFGSWP